MGVITAPNFAIWTPDEGWVVENVGVPPDIEVEQMPADVISGHDLQLEKTIQVVTDELKKSPASSPKRSAYPVKRKAGDRELAERAKATQSNIPSGPQPSSPILVSSPRGAGDQMRQYFIPPSADHS